MILRALHANRDQDRDSLLSHLLQHADYMLLRFRCRGYVGLPLYCCYGLFAPDNHEQAIVTSIFTGPGIWWLKAIAATEASRPSTSRSSRGIGLCVRSGEP
jgi:hypothetical protein